MKFFKEDKNINIKIIKEEYGIIINIHGIWHHETIIQQNSIMDQHLLQIGEASTTIHGIKGRKIIQQPNTKDYDRKELILDGWIIINGRNKEGT
jgi:hypothetical protein